MLCKYKNIFGQINTGTHSYRLFNIAIVDTGLTILLSIILSYAFDSSILIIFLILMIVAILLHKLFCVETTITMWIFG
jgi:hypothetical protein